jgi:hypothetical protein
MKLNLLLGLFLFSYCTTQAQGLAVNSDGSTADASALLDVKSSTKGMLVPRMIKTEKNSISSPATGLMIFQTGPDSTGFHYYSGSQWVWISSSANAWQLSGNSGTSPASNFIGTTDNNPLVFRTQNAEAMRITSGGIFGIGTTTPNTTYGFARMEIATEGVNTPSDMLIRNAANSAGYAPGLIFQHARGTLATPLAVTSGDYASAVGSMNYSGSSYVQSHSIDMYVDGAVTSTIVPGRFEFVTRSTTGSYGTRLTIKNDGKVGIGTTSPSSTLQVDGTFAVGVSLTVAGGSSGSPASLSSYKGYIGLSPTGGNDYYELPDPASCPGRIYYIRNNNNPGADYAFIRSAGSGLMCEGGGACLGTGAYKTITTGSPNPVPKTIICISDGVNWTVGSID